MVLALLYLLPVSGAALAPFVRGGSERNACRTSCVWGNGVREEMCDYELDAAASNVVSS